MTIDGQDRLTLRDLAKEVADIAAEAVMAERKRKWTEHNSLRTTGPMLLVFPEGAWEELLPDSSLKCRGTRARAIEWNLRSRIYTYRHFHDDTVVEAEWVERAVISDTGWGLEPAKAYSAFERGAYHIEPVLKEYDDLKKMHYPEVIYDERASQQKVVEAQDLFGDILEVRAKGKDHVSFHLAAEYIFRRGLNEMMMDMVDAPEFLHETMAFLAEGNRRLLQQWIDLNLLSLNNDNTYQSSGGNGYTDQLPAAGFDPGCVRPRDMWASAESQELALVSPQMHDEFLMQYERRLLEPFGLTGYGCCEDLSNKLDQVLAIPHIRRISVSPFANVDRCAERLKGGYIFSWKPNPAHLVGEFDLTAIRDYIRHTLEVAQAHGCVLEIILKDTHTCESRPERFDAWTRVARELIEAFPVAATN